MPVSNDDLASNHPSEASAPADATSDGAPPTALTMIARLRAEADAAVDPLRKAVLLHEAGELQERAVGDELTAAREYLAAYNAEPSFREPLEALVRILERRRSLKNLSRVLENLSKGAETAEERARALRARAMDALDVRNSRDEAHELLEQAIDADPTDLTTWLFSELDAGARGDVEARIRALSRRVELETDPRWQALLRIDLAEMRAAQGDADDALDILTEVITSNDVPAFHACEVAERLARAADKGDREAWALVQRGEILLESLGESPSLRGQGVPTTLRHVGVASDAFVRAASAYRSVGRIEEEITTLERAIEVDRKASTPHLARIAAATRLGDLERASTIAKELLDRGARTELAPSLWLTVAEASLAQGDRDAVLLACEKLISVSEAHEALRGGDSKSHGIVGRTLLVDLLLDGSDPAKLGELVESDAAARPTVDGRARGELLAAVTWALYAGDATKARAALERATSTGIPALTAARMARALSSSVLGVEGEADDLWYQHSLEALVEATKDPVERADALLELSRFHFSSGQNEKAREALEKVGEKGPRSLAARALRLGLFGDAAGDHLMMELSVGAEPDHALSFAVARAVRAARMHDDAGRAAAIEAIASASETDGLSALMRVNAAIRTRPADAAATLRELSRTQPDPTGRDVLRIAAGVLLARAGNLEGALELLGEAETEAQDVLPAAQFIWERFRVKGESNGRRVTLELGSKGILLPNGWSSLERAADRLIAPGEEGAPVAQLLNDLESSGDAQLSRAALILRATWPDGNVDIDARDDAMLSLEKLGPDASRWVTRTKLRTAEQAEDFPAAVIAAANWHQASGSTPSALEMLVQSLRGRDLESEIRARTALSVTLGGTAGDKLLASAALVAHLTGQSGPSLAAARDPEARVAVGLVACEIAGPGDDPASRETALSHLAEVVEQGSATLLEMAAWSALARGDASAAKQLFARAAELGEKDKSTPRSCIEGAIEAELLLAGGRPSLLWAELCEKLAAMLDVVDKHQAADLFEQVGHAYWDALGQEARGERALLEAFDREPTRRQAFDRVFRAVRSRKQDDLLLTIVGKRLDATDDPPEMAKLFWEQARVLHAKGDKDGALASLENVTMLEPDHIGGLALSAGIYASRQMFDEAATAFDRLSRQPVPPQQKLAAGIGAADIYEGKLSAPAKVVDVLVALDQAGIADAAIHERIARAAIAAEDWATSTTYLAKLVRERTQPDGRIEAARTAAVVFRDKLNNPVGAVPSLIALLREAPEDPDAVEQLLDAGADPGAIQDTLMACLDAARTHLAQNPTDGRYARILGRVGFKLGSAELEQIACSALLALGTATPEEQRKHGQLLGRLAAMPNVAFGSDGQRLIASPLEPAAITALFRLLGPTLAEAFGPTLDGIGVGRREKVDSRAGSILRNEIGAWLGAVGVAEFEFYVGGRDPNLIQAVPGDTPSFVVGANIRGPLSRPDRARVVREVVAMERGTTLVRSRDDIAIAAIVVAVFGIAEIPVRAPAYPVLAETQRLISKAISRKTKKALPELLQNPVFASGDFRTFRGGALRTLDRAALVATGDPSSVLADVVGGNQNVASISADTRASDLLRFGWSDDYLALRRQLGLGIG